MLVALLGRKKIIFEDAKETDLNISSATRTIKKTHKLRHLEMATGTISTISSFRAFNVIQSITSNNIDIYK
jgi:hypothetical protein